MSYRKIGAISIILVVFIFSIIYFKSEGDMAQGEIDNNYSHYISVRQFFEFYGADVNWDEGNDTALIKLNSHEIRLLANSNTVYLDDKILKVQQITQLKNDTLMVAPSTITMITKGTVPRGGIVPNLWDKTVCLHLEDELWNEQNIYDAGHFLMVPLHAAFLLDNLEWQNQFASHFTAFMENKDFIAEGKLNQLHYYYLISRFIVLADEAGKSELIPVGMDDYIYDEIINIWYNAPAWQWEHSDFKGIKERVEWKLSNLKPKRSYYRAIIDEELFTFAIAGDLFNYYEKKDGIKQDKLEDILNSAYQIFNKEVEYNGDGSWLFQPGVWAEHPDYVYVGNEYKVAGMDKKPISDIAMDTSHSHRFPLWITSLAGAYKPNNVQGILYNDLLLGLEKQFISKVLVNPNNEFPAYRTNNFMDGRNGVYRWNYVTQGENNGYGAYELSGTISLGWWTFLGGDEIKQLYNEISTMFPLSDDVIELYIGPNTTRERHPLVSGSNMYVNGYAELISKLASEI